MQNTLQVEPGASVGGYLPTTRWTLVLGAGDPTSPESQEALDVLCRAYWYPLYVYVRRRGHPPPDAQDLIQGFFARLLGTHGLATVQRQRGRFRSFLLTSLEHYLSDQWDKANAQKRGRGTVAISIDEQQAEGRYLSEPVDDCDPASLFEFRWAMNLLTQADAALAADYQARGKARRFEVLHQFLHERKGIITYAEAGILLGISEGAVTQEVGALRRRFGELLRAAIRDTVRGESEVEAEISHLIRVVSQRGRFSR